MDTRKTVHMGMLVALAMILSFIESQIPAFVAIPGIKVGLANIAVIFALYRFGFRVKFILIVYSTIGSVQSVKELPEP